MVADYRRVHANNESLCGSDGAEEPFRVRAAPLARGDDGPQGRAARDVPVTVVAADGAAARAVSGDSMNRPSRSRRGRSRVSARRLPVSIVIPAFGAAAQLQACLDSLARVAPPAGCEVLVADDATPDDSVSEVVEIVRVDAVAHLRAARHQSRICRELQRGHSRDSAARQRRAAAQLGHTGHRGFPGRDVGRAASAREAWRRVATEQQRHDLLGSCRRTSAAGRRLSALEGRFAICCRVIR